MAKKVFKNPGKIVRDDSGKPILDANGNSVYAPQSGAANVTMAPWEYLMALPENAVADAVFGLAGKVTSPLIRKIAPKTISKASSMATGLNSKYDNMLKAYHDYHIKPNYSTQETDDVIGALKQRLSTDEGKKRLANLNRSDFDPSKIKIIEDNTSYGYASGIHPMIGLNKNLPKESIKPTLRHEIEHVLQGGESTNIDDLLSNLELRKTPRELPNNGYSIRSKSIEVPGYDINSLLSNKQNATDYFHSGSAGKEKSSMLAELQQHLVDNKYISHPYATNEITPEKIKDVFIDQIGNEGGYPLRILNIMKPSEKNYNILSDGLNKMITTAPLLPAAGIAINKNNKDMKKQYKSGGRLSRSFGFNSPDYSTGGNLYFLGGNTDKKTNQGVNVSGLADMAIPGAGAAMSLVSSAGDSVGGGLGAAINGSVNPFAATFNKNLKPWQRALGTINPALGGLMSYNEQQKEDNFNSDAADMRQRNEMLGIKANGGPLKQYDITNNTKPFDDWYNSQPFYTEALQNKYKDLPTKNILSNSINDKSFSNRNLNQYGDSLISKYGDKYLTEHEVDSVARRNNIPNIFDLNNQMKSIESKQTGSSANTKGAKEDSLNKYGYRMMLQRSFPQGQSPYKAAGGYILPQGVSNNMATQYADGGMLNEFATGGSHESHPQSGVPQGVAEDGQINRVEQGETKYQDYIFSDRLKLDEQAIKEHNLPKYMINKTFAEASKRISKLHKERPNDPITRDTMKSKMDHLMMANDEIREYEQSSMMAMGGHLYDGLSEKTGHLQIGSKYYDDKGGEFMASRIGNDFFTPGLKQPLGTGKFESDKLTAKANSISDNNKPGLGFLKDPKNLRYAPIAFDALAATGLFGKSPKPEQYSPTLIQQQGNLTAPQINEEAMRSKIDAAYQNQIRGLAGASGGSGAALRSGLTGLSDDYMSAVGQGFLGADTANKQAKMQADQYDLGTSQNVASQNAQMQNQAGLYNNQMANQNNALNYDTRMSYLGKGAEGLGDIGYEARNAEILPRLFGYNQYGEYRPLNAKACGGRLKLMRRKK